MQKPAFAKLVLVTSTALQQAFTIKKYLKKEHLEETITLIFF